jgi:hypothetical protein
MMAVIGESWQMLSQTERDNWNNQAEMIQKRRITGFKLYTQNAFGKRAELIVKPGYPGG